MSIPRTHDCIQKDKNHILAFLPVMKELELMGHNPVKVVFGGGMNITEIEACYVAIGRAKVKYPKWYKVVSEWINKI